LFSGLSTKCSLLPSQLRSICETGLSKVINYLKEGLQSRIPDCALLCANPSPINAHHFCSLLHPAFNSLDDLFSDLSSTLIPTICFSHTDQPDCVKKIDGLLKIAKNPVTNAFKRVGLILQCDQFKSTGDGGKLGLDWTPLHLLCTGCQTTLKGISLTFDGEGTSHLIDALHKTFESACQMIKEDDPSLLDGAP
ncbi:hypothetical protein PENTCL1PPCAC_22976, partial [Pristionchus entomophagus]